MHNFIPQYIGLCCSNESDWRKIQVLEIDSKFKGHLLRDTVENTQSQSPVWSPDGKVSILLCRMCFPPKNVAQVLCKLLTGLKVAAVTGSPDFHMCALIKAGRSLQTASLG